MTNKTAWNELQFFLQDDEKIDAISFGAWGWGDFNETKVSPIPKSLQRKPMTPEEAKPYMQSWRFNGGYGSPDCYATNIWTNQRIIWVSTYDGSTWLTGMPRHPDDALPQMSGGG